MRFEQNLEEKENIFFVCEIHRSNAYRVFSGNQETETCPHCGSHYFGRHCESLEGWINFYDNQLKVIKHQLKNPIRYRIDKKRKITLKKEILKIKSILDELNKIKNR